MPERPNRKAQPPHAGPDGDEDSKVGAGLALAFVVLSAFGLIAGIFQIVSRKP